LAKVTLKLAGQTVLAETMSFKTMEEPWSFYRLEDGTVLKLKPVVSDIVKLPVPDPVTGLPQFLVKSSAVISVEPLAPKSEGH
jgi:hypothetical protein